MVRVGQVDRRARGQTRPPRTSGLAGPHARFPADSPSQRRGREARHRAPIRLAAALALLVVAGVWGSSYLVVKDLLSILPPARYLALRYLLALPFVAVVFHRPLLHWYRSAWAPSGTRDRARYVLPGLFLVLAMATQAYGIRSSSPGVAAFLSSLVFCFVPIFEIVSGEWIRLRFLVTPFVLALAGTVLITGVLHASFSMSDGLLIVCALGYAGQIFFTARLARSSHFAVPFVTQGVVVLTFALIGSLLLDGRTEYSLHPSVVLRLCYVALVATVFCYLVQNWAQRHVRSRYVGFIYALEPAVALLMSVRLGYEPAQTAIVVGCLAILAAALVSLWFSTIDTPEQRGMPQEMA